MKLELSGHGSVSANVNQRSVLLINHSFPPYEFSGTPLVTRDYALGLKTLGYRVGS